MTPDTWILIILGFIAVCVLGLAAVFGWRSFLVAGAIILGLALMVFPNGTVLIFGTTVLGIVYVMARFMGGPSITVNCGDGDGDRNISIDASRR